MIQTSYKFSKATRIVEAIGYLKTKMIIMSSKLFAFSLLLYSLQFWINARSAHASEPEVRAAIASYVAAFNDQDLERLGKMWAEDSLHVDLTLNQQTKGRTAILADLEKAFHSDANIQISGTIEDLRMIKDDVATVSGQVVLSRNSTSPMRNHFNAVLVKSVDGWMIDKMEETSVATPLNATAALRQLQWLVGDWQDNSQATPIQSTIAWAQGESFLIRTWETATESGDIHHSTQIIGWDASSQQILSWTFNADGSFGHGLWTKENSGWTIAATQSLGDGRISTGTYLMDIQDNDHFTMQLIGHEIDGEPQPTDDPITVTRIVATAEVNESAVDSTPIPEQTPAK